MDGACKEKTTFICSYGTYQFEVMPFGLMILGATFQRMMDSIIANVRNVKCYVDDVVIHSATKEGQMVNLDTVMKLLLLCPLDDVDGAHGDAVKVEKIKSAKPSRIRKTCDHSSGSHPITIDSSKDSQR